MAGDWLLEIYDDGVKETGTLNGWSLTFVIAVPTPPSVSIDDVTANEGDGSADFTVSLSKPADTDVTVQYATSDDSPAPGSATAGSDYESTSGTAIILTGDTTATISVPIIDDSTTDEGIELFYIDILGATGATIADNQGEGTIVDNDITQPPQSFSINDVSKREGRDGKTTTFTFAVTRSGDTSGEATIYYATAFDTAGAHAATSDDFLPVTISPLYFGAGETTQTISVTVYGDAVAEYDETFLVNVFEDSGGSVVLDTGTGTIINDDKGDPFESASATDAALSSLLETELSAEEENDLLLTQVADDLALAMGQ
jgi:hypothetical protein